MRLSRDSSPETILKSRDLSPNALASSLRIALLVFPSTAGAWTVTTRRVGSPELPPTLLLDALARTRMSKVKIEDL
jgi:hypothetical protein